MKDWTLAVMINAYIPVNSPYEVYIANSESKTQQSAVLRLVSGKYSTYRLEGTMQELKVVSSSDEPRVFIKCSYFPEPEEWYELMNFKQDTLHKILTQVKNSGGVLEEAVDVIFNITEDCPWISFVNSSMSEYKDCLEEFERRVNYSCSKKTKAWKAGHLYQTLNDTYYVLGKYSNRKQSPSNSKFLEDNLVTEAYLVVRRLTGEKKVSEVLKSRAIGSFENGNDEVEIFFKKDLVSAVDCGKVLETDVDNISDCWEDLFDNTCNRYRVLTWFGREYYKNIKEVLDIFSIQSPQDLTYTITSKLKNKITKLLKVWCWDVYIKNLDKKRNFNNLLSTNLPEVNIKILTNLMLLSILDENITSIGYYTTLLERLGISISKICKTVIKDWSPELFSTDFDYFCKNINYLTGTVELGNIEKFTAVIENYKDIYQYREAVKDVIKEPELSEIIVDIANNCTTPSDDYFIDSGRRKLYIVEVSLLDVIDYMEKNKDRVNRSLVEKEILNSSFVVCRIMYEKEKGYKIS